MYENLHLAQRDAQLRRQSEEDYARRWRLGSLARPRPRAQLQLRARLGNLARTVSQQASQWLARPSKPQEQCC
ncbi:MAG: hypothetical protein P8129_22015 [Anaerolineae bacterium]